MDRIIVAGSLNPDKDCQDRVRVLFGGGICQSLRATDYKDPPKCLVEVKKWKENGEKSSQQMENTS